MVIDERLRAQILAAIPAMCLLSGDSGTYFGIGRAPDIATWLADHGMLILGMEGFRCDGKAVEPLTDYIADFSSLADSGADKIDAGRRAALIVLRQWSDDVQFVEFTIA
jgi:hypothetical protein